MTKIPSVEEAIEQIGIATYGGRSFEPTGMYREKLTKILNTQRTALLIELRDSGLLENKPMNVFSFVLQGEELEHYMRHKGHNLAVEAIKAHLDELINSTK